MSITVQWLGHASFKIVSEGTVVYIDPWKLEDAPHDGSVILVSHSHYDHYSAGDVARAAGGDSELIGSADVVAQHGSGRAVGPGETLEFEGGKVTAVAAYNPKKQYHPRANKWVGFIIEMGGKRIYYAGDTDMTGEMQGLSHIDLALLPVGGTYTMNAKEAAQAVNKFKPAQAVPYHWGDIVGDEKDAEKFKNNAACQVTILTPGQSLTL